MKKFLSLMLTLALIITTLALPVSVSALNIKGPQKANGSIDISYAITSLDGNDEITTFHPGDAFKVTVKATATENTSAQSYVLDVKYSSDITVEKLDSSDTSITLVNKNNNSYVQKINETAVEFTANTAVELFSFKATIKDTATGNLEFDLFTTDDNQFYKEFTTNGDSIYATTATFTKEANLTCTVKSISVTANTFEVKVGEQKMENNKTLYGVTAPTSIAVTGTNITEVKVTVGEGEATDATAVTTGSSYSYAIETLSADTTYTVSVKTKGAADASSMTFTLSPTTVNAQLTLDETGLSADGYTRSVEDSDVTFEVPVKITGLGSATAAMVSFKVTTPEGLELVTTDNSLYDSSTQTFVYGNATNENGLANDVEVTKLKFKVKSDAAYGVKDVTLNTAKLALVKDIDPTEDTISCDNAKASVVVIPTGDFVTVTNFSSSWTNTAYDATVTKDDAVTAKYKASDATEITANKDSFDAEGWTNITDGKMNISSSNTYYIIARVGNESKAVYKVYSYAVNTTKFDNTKPTVGVTNVTGTDGWKNADTYTLDISNLSVNKNDELSDITSKQYQLYTVNGEQETEFGSATAINDSDTSISFEGLGSSFDGVIKFNATDAAGNISDWSEGVTLKLDKDDPTVGEVTAGNKDAEGNVKLTTTATDASSGVKEVKVYFDSAEAEDKATVTDVEALSESYAATAGDNTTYTYDASKTGKYYFVAEDNTGRKSATVVKYDLTLDTLSKAADISVQVNPDGNYHLNKFFSTSDTDKNNTYGTNGYYMYVSVKAESLGDKYETTMRYYTGIEAPTTDEGWTAYTAETAITTAGDYTFEVTSKLKNSSFADDTKTATYKFSIAEDKAHMISPSGDGNYNLLDLMMIKRVLAKEENSRLPENSDWFATLYAGDLNGDFVYTTEDTTAILDNLRAGNAKGEYDFGIMKNQKTTVVEP